MSDTPRTDAMWAKIVHTIDAKDAVHICESFRTLERDLAASEADAERIDALAELYRVCPHAVLTFNDDADDERAPAGYSISIEGCDSVEYVAPTLREVIDLSRHEFDAARAAGEGTCQK